MAWRTVTWRRGTNGRLSARFAALRVRVADGSMQRMHDMGNQHMAGNEAWLIGEHRASGERKCYLSNLPTDTPIKALASTIQGALGCEQAHQKLKEKLGLDHNEFRPGDVTCRVRSQKQDQIRHIFCRSGHSQRS